MHFKVVHDSRIGRRSNNQDRLGWGQSDQAVYLIVADGMGGHSAGEVASQLAVEVISRIYYEESSDARTALEKAFHEANREIYQAARRATRAWPTAP